MAPEYGVNMKGVNRGRAAVVLATREPGCPGPHPHRPRGAIMFAVATAEPM